MADREIVPQSGSAITVKYAGAGKAMTLEEVRAAEEAKELGETLVPDTVVPYHKARTKFKEANGITKAGRVLTRREINKEQWEKQLMDANSIDEAIIAVLLEGKEVLGSDIRDQVLKTQPEVSNKKYAMRCSYLMHKTDFGLLVERRRAGKGVAYKLVTAALDCRVQELAVFAYKHDKAREEVLAHHKALKPYFESADKPATRWRDQAKSPDLQPPTKPPLEIQGTIENAISNALGLNVSVQGRIEIVFKLGD